MKNILNGIGYTLNQIRNQEEIISGNPLNKNVSVFSQNEEDGITLEILNRLGLEKGSFCEFGVGNGSENNTMLLVSLGWKGFWCGGEDLAFNTYSPNDNFIFKKTWITLDNIVNLFKQGCDQVNIKDVDVLSLDLDGNDIYFAEALLENVKPKLFIVEYNAKFVPPIRFQIDYDEQHSWDGGDYFGASLQTFVDLFNKYEYTLVSTNCTGSNAFFVRNSDLELFSDVDLNIRSLYNPPRYDRTYKKGIHGMSIKTFEWFFERLSK